jgi:beta-lactamase class D
MKRIISFFILLFTAIAPCNTIEEKDFGALFNGYDGSIVVYDKIADNYIVHNKKRSVIRYSPFSTFKIPNSIVALETVIIPDVDSTFQWDTIKYLPEAWWPEQWKGTHTMRTAIKYSVVPFYRAIATEIGEKRMKEYLIRFNYGNVDISSGIDAFWLNGSLGISAMEQIMFLKKFYDNSLGVNEHTINAVKNILVQKETGSYRISAKTGGGNGIDKNDPGKYRGWYVGYVEKGKDVFFFALNIDGTDTPDIRNARISITESVLKALKIIE